MSDAELSERLFEQLRGGDRSAVAQALNLIDDQRPQQRATALALLDRLAKAEGTPGQRESLRVGITGAPGAGKSTLLDALVSVLRERGQTVGLIAVDPSSRRSGGALLGDRIRMRSSTRDPGVFLRSMAARERLGGLADATFPGVTILAASFDWVFVETVGVGQSEGDVAPLIDTLVFVAQPGAGDMMQFMKAGIIELPDIFLVNKADLGAPAQRTAAELDAALGLGESARADWQPPILLGSAQEGIGIEALVEQIEAHHRHLVAKGELATEREKGRFAYLAESLERRYGSYGLERVGGRKGLAARMRANPGQSTFALAQSLAGEIELALGERSASGTE